jgi:hypothetical protein
MPRLGTCPGPVPDDLVELRPELLTPCSCASTASPDVAGHALLYAVAAWTGLLLTRQNAQGEGDDGRPTCLGASRPNHIPPTEGLYRLAYHFSSFPKPHEEGETPWSDHLPICLSFPCPAQTQARPPKRRGGARAPSLLWAPERTEEYGTALWQVRAEGGYARVLQACEGQDLDTTDQALLECDCSYTGGGHG